MRLRLKTLLALLVVTGVLATATYLLGRYYIFEDLNAIELKEVKEETAGALEKLNSELRELRLLAMDNAVWDDAYAYMKTEDPKFPRKAFPVESFPGVRIQLLAYVNESGRILHVELFDGKQVSGASDRPDVVQEILRLSKKTMRGNELRLASGIVVLKDGAMLLAASPILTSAAKGPARGVLICGRRLDSAELGLLAPTTNFKLAITSPERWTSLEAGGQQPQQQKDSATTVALADSDSLHRSSLSFRTVPIAARPLSKETIAGFALLPGLDDQPGAVLQMTRRREIQAQKSKATEWFLGMILAGAALFCLVVLAVLEVTVLRRVAGLSHEVEEIGKRGDLNRRVTVSGNDEITSLAGKVNETLEILQLLNEWEGKAQDLLHSTFENAAIGMAIISLDGRWIRVNGELCELLGYDPEELLSRSFREIMPEEDCEDEISRQKDLLSGEASNYETTRRWVHKNGQIVWNFLNVALVRESHGHPAYFVVQIREMVGTLKPN